MAFWLLPEHLITCKLILSCPSFVILVCWKQSCSHSNFQGSCSTYTSSSLRESLESVLKSSKSLASNCVFECCQRHMWTQFFTAVKMSTWNTIYMDFFHVMFEILILTSAQPACYSLLFNQLSLLTAAEGELRLCLHIINEGLSLNNGNEQRDGFL